MKAIPIKLPKRLKVAACSINSFPLDWDGNLKRTCDATKEAVLLGAQLVVHQELGLSGYTCDDYFFFPCVMEEALERLHALRPYSKGIALVVGVPLLYNDCVYNTACLMVDGEIIGFVPKQNLANNGHFYERRHFRPWPKGKVVRLPEHLGGYLFGDLVFDISGVVLGLEICEDVWGEDPPNVRMASRGVTIVANPSASPFAIGKHAYRRKLITMASAQRNVVYIYTNPSGLESGIYIFDTAQFVVSAGEMAAEAPRFSFKPYSVITAVVDLELNRVRRHGLDSHHPIVEPDNGLVTVKTEMRWQEPDPTFSAPSLPDWESSPFLEFEECSRAIGLGLFDYIRKGKMKGSTLSFSGGTDSSMVGVFMRVMTHLMMKGLGEEIVEAFAHIPKLKTARDEAEIMKLLLITAYQGTVNSSPKTREAARKLAEELCSNHTELEVDDIIEATQKKVEMIIKRPLTWEKDDITMQNFGPRARKGVILGVANAEGMLDLGTGNVDELVVGYCTLGGDLVAGANPIGTLPKPFLRRQAKWFETDGLIGMGPIKSLAFINALLPSADLRPYALNQTDEGDLMPYPVLAQLRTWFSRDRKGPAEILHFALIKWNGVFPEIKLLEWVMRFFRLLTINQFKRFHNPVTFELTGENMEPGSACRLPVLCAGFEWQIKPMRERYEQLKAAV